MIKSKDREMFNKIMEQDYVWYGMILLDHDQLYNFRDRFGEYDGPGYLKLKRINLKTYSRNHLKVTFRLAYYFRTDGDKNVIVNNYWWIDFIVEDEFGRTGKKKLIHLSLNSYQDGAEDLLKTFRVKEKKAYFFEDIKNGDANYCEAGNWEYLI